jgi:hypothetical protein
MRRIDTHSADIGPPLVIADEQGAEHPSSGRALATPPRGGQLQIGVTEIKSESVADFIPESVPTSPGITQSLNPGGKFAALTPDRIFQPTPTVLRKFSAEEPYDHNPLNLTATGARPNDSHIDASSYVGK